MQNQTLVAAPIAMGKPKIPMDKSAQSFDQLVPDQIAKGDNENVARQKIAYAYPNLCRASETISKSADDVVTFLDVRCFLPRTGDSHKRSGRMR